MEIRKEVVDNIQIVKTQIEDFKYEADVPNAKVIGKSSRNSLRKNQRSAGATRHLYQAITRKPIRNLLDQRRSHSRRHCRSSGKMDWNPRNENAPRRAGKTITSEELHRGSGKAIKRKRCRTP